MKKSSNFATMVPRARVRLNNASGALLCEATGATSVTTMLSAHALSCVTAANIAVTGSDRFYLWVGVNVTGSAGNHNVMGELDVEGTLNGNYDSRVVMPSIVPAPVITALTPDVGTPGTPVSITGVNFGATQGSSTVTFNGVAASISAWSDTSISTSVPVGASSGPVVVTVNGIASAERPFILAENCPDSQTVIGPTDYFHSGNALTTIDVPLVACELLTVEVVVEAPPGGVSANVEYRTIQNVWMFQTPSLCYATCTIGPVVIPMTRGVNWRPNKIVLSSWSIDQTKFTVTLTKTPRPGYNTGGTGPTSAPLFSVPTTVYGTLHGSETESQGSGQFFKVRLAPGESIRVFGTAHNWGGYSTFFQVDLFDAAYALIGPLGWWGIPEGNPTPFESSTYTHTGATTADFYIKASAAQNYVHDLVMTLERAVGNPGPGYTRLKLFLDINGNFDPASPDSDEGTFVPGQGPGVQLPTATTPIQRVRLIAAFVNGSNAIVPPPDSSITFSLSETSAFDGVAMNAADPRDGSSGPQDYALESTSATFDPDNTARVWLQVWDYGGFTKVTGFSTSQSTLPMRLPTDGNHNWLPDGGWNASGTPVTDPGTIFVDVDSGPSGNPEPGDGFVDFQEYRGFFVNGQHVRLRPAVKDLFVVSLLPQGVGFADNLLINVIQLMGNEIGSNRDVNHRWSNGNPVAEGSVNSAYVQNHYLQKAPMLIGNLYDPVYFGATFTGQGVTSPYPPSAVVAPSRIYTLKIAEHSPDHNDQTHLDDPYDYKAIQSTIAHEIGHQVGLDHIAVGQVCPPPVWTVMVTDYFGLPTTNLGACAWVNIPDDYQASELTSIILR